MRANSHVDFRRKEKRLEALIFFFHSWGWGEGEGKDEGLEGEIGPHNLDFIPAKGIIIWQRRLGLREISWSSVRMVQ